MARRVRLGRARSANERDATAAVLLMHMHRGPCTALFRAVGPSPAHRATGTAAVCRAVPARSSAAARAAESEVQITEKTQPNPQTAYGRSKLEAERAIRKALSNTACAWTILRPPLVYGKGNKANFGLLLKLVKSGIPLQLASVRNRRSFIYVENLVDVIVASLGNPNAFGKIYLPSDGEDVSTPELIRKIAKANQSFQFSEFSGSVSDKNTRHSSLATRHSARLFPFPESILKALGRLPGLGALRKLTSSLYVDSEPLREDLGWSPQIKMEEGLVKTLRG